MSLIQTFPSGKSENGGHTIINANDIAMPAQDKLKFGGDFETTDNDEDGQTEVVPHELTDADMQEIMSVIPGAPRIDRVSGGFTPIGTVISVMGNTAPLHYLECNGQTVNIIDYPELANYFLAQFGSKNYFGGDGTITFAIPDLRGEFLRGTGINSHTNQGSGANVGVHQNATTVNPGWVNNVSGGFSKVRTPSAEYSDLLGFNEIDSSVNSGTRHSIIGSTELKLTSNTAADVTVVSTRPTNTSVLYCIATKDIYMDPSNNYSTDEKVVGTWIDGKPLYQKVVTGHIGTTAPWGAIYSENGIYIRNILFAFWEFNDTNVDYLPLPYYGSSNTYGLCGLKNGVFVGRGSKAADVLTCIQYTKTTD